MDSQQNIADLYDACKKLRDKAQPLWDTIGRHTGLTVNTGYHHHNQADAAAQKDEHVDDPTSAISVNQAGDYLIGILWGTGDDVVEMVPSRYVLEYATKAELDAYYKFCSDQLLHHMNHADAGFHTALRPYAYDQFSFGTSGIGLFPNPAFVKGIDENAFIFRQYGVDNVVIDEGKAGQVDTIFATYHWRLNRVIGEFCGENPSPAQVAKLPKEIQDAYRNRDFNKEFKVVFGMFPARDYHPKLKGKRGARYRGVWFLDEGDRKPFDEEHFNEKPIAMARHIKIRGEVWGRSPGTLLISSIRGGNFLLGQGIEIVEKMSRPSLGIFGNAIFGDGVLDTSPDGLTVFNSMFMGASQAPAFPLYDVGDPSKLLQFIVPYLNEKIVTAFKVDALLDFSSAKEMTATESLQRYAIRGKSLSGMLALQKNEMLVPTCRRGVSVLDNMGQLGVSAERLTPDVLKRLNDVGRSDRIIPAAVEMVKKQGRPWYELKFNNELEKLTRTEAVQNLIQILQAIQAIYAIYPIIAEAVDWYKLLEDINSNLDSNNQILIGPAKFKEIVIADAEQRKAAMMLQAGTAMTAMGKDTAQSRKLNSEAASAAR